MICGSPQMFQHLPRARPAIVLLLINYPSLAENIISQRVVIEDRIALRAVATTIKVKVLRTLHKTRIYRELMEETSGTTLQTASDEKDVCRNPARSQYTQRSLMFND